MISGRVTVVDLESVGYYCGLGDIAMPAWLAAGEGYWHPARLLPRRNVELLHLLA